MTARRQQSALALQCAELAEAWIAGDTTWVRLQLTTGRSRARSVALAIGTTRALQAFYGDDRAAEFALVVTRPFGGHL